MPASPRKPATSRLLDALPAADRVRMLGRCETVELSFAEVLADSGEPCRYVYFPLTSFISLIAALSSHERLEVGIVGDEGMLGTSLALGVDISPIHAVVQGAGTALRMPAADFVAELAHSPELRAHLNRYLFILMNQLAQTAACTRYHVVESRLARWLLLTRDRAHATRFHLTQEFIAHMLGVRRVGVTKAASALEARGLIAYSRGDIRILDLKGLEAVSCKCYRDGKRMYDQILGAKRATPRS